MTRFSMRAASLTFTLMLASFLSAGQQQPAQPSSEKNGAPQNPSPLVEHTRSHPRLPKQPPEGRRENLSLGTLFIPAKLKLKSPVPVLFFFHSPSFIPETAAAKNGMVAVNILIGAGSSAYARPFTDPTLFGKLLREAEAKAGVQLRPITLAGWSAGCGAIRQIMSTPEYYDEIANTIMIDGIHTSESTASPALWNRRSIPNRSRST